MRVGATLSFSRPHLPPSSAGHLHRRVPPDGGAELPAGVRAPRAVLPTEAQASLQNAAEACSCLLPWPDGAPCTPGLHGHLHALPGLCPAPTHARAHTHAHAHGAHAHGAHARSGQCPRLLGTGCSHALWLEPPAGTCDLPAPERFSEPRCAVLRPGLAGSSRESMALKQPRPCLTGSGGWRLALSHSGGVLHAPPGSSQGGRGHSRLCSSTRPGLASFCPVSLPCSPTCAPRARRPKHLHEGPASAGNQPRPLARTAHLQLRPGRPSAAAGRACARGVRSAPSQRLRERRDSAPGSSLPFPRPRRPEVLPVRSSPHAEEHVVFAGKPSPARRTSRHLATRLAGSVTAYLTTYVGFP